MNLINYGKCFLWTFGLLLILSLLISILYYFNMVPRSVISYTYFIIPTLSMLIGAFIVGRNSREKGFLEGLKFGIIYLILSNSFSFLILRNSFGWKVLLYNGILLLVSMFGSMIGINFKKGKQL